MAKHYQVVHGGGLKSVDTNESNEHQRKYSEDKWKKVEADPKCNIDRSRGHLNFEIGKGGKIYPLGTLPSVSARYKARLAETGARDPNQKYIDAHLAHPFRVAYEIILSGDTEVMRNLAFGDQEVSFEKGADNSWVKRRKAIEKWARAHYNAVARRYGEDNIIGFSVHLDENSPHLHCVVTPVYPHKDKKTGEIKTDPKTGKPIYKVQFRDTFGGDSNIIGQLHDYFYDEVNCHWGLDRGESVAETGAKHVNRAEFYRQLKEKCKNLEEEIAKKEKAVKGLNTMISNLEKQKDSLSDELYILQSQLENGEGDRDELEKQIEKIKYQKSIIDEKLNDKREKLMDTEGTLSDLKNLLSERQHEYENLRNVTATAKRNKELIASELKDMTDEVKPSAKMYVKSKIMDDMCDQFKNKILPNLKDVDLSDTYFEDIKNDCLTDIVNDAADTFVQGAGTATSVIMDMVLSENYAPPSSGGGGSSNNDDDKKRKEDEDYAMWARRCGRMAHKAHYAPRHSWGRGR